MGWAHRVVRTKTKHGSTLAIHEVFLDDQGRVHSCTVEPVHPYVDESDGETVEDLKKSAQWFLDACDKPVLDMESIPELGAKSPF